MKLQLLIVLGLYLVLTSGALIHADERIPGVSLLLSKVAVERGAEDTRFRCQVAIDNQTGEELRVESNFYSAFDGLELVVTNVDGKVLWQQYYIYHQSPFSIDGKQFVLKRGQTEKTMVFPVRSCDMVGQPIKVRLVGTLPGSTYKRILSTDTIKTVIGKVAETNGETQ